MDSEHLREIVINLEGAYSALSLRPLNAAVALRLLDSATDRNDPVLEVGAVQRKAVTSRSRAPVKAETATIG
jgi:hypothetical protein